MLITDLIKQNLAGLSNKQKKIARYLIRNKNKIAFMSLKELSNELEVSEVTILNFCKAINMESFTDLKKEFQILIKEELKVPAKMKSSLEELKSLEDAVGSTLQIQKNNFEYIIENNTIDSLHTASQLIADASTVYLCGLNISKLICDFLYPRLKRLGIHVRILTLDDVEMLSNELIHATEKDLFLLISFPIYSDSIVKLSQYLAMQQLRFIAITNNDQSPIAREAKVVLKSENHSLVFYNFISAAITLAELLLVVLSYEMKDRIILDIKAIETLHHFFRDEKEKKKAKGDTSQ
ncbi:MurR/RpiR family transcriptional regulator [Geosporobacter ferrireducens]|uniref:RpiR family transcriptional regulator n=1 Tax=Geosporobacter ferrireducens TaxID=1424294 RepID=A0A1D8GFH4_9FIRM|nr:MurR/RpiR family transcriptional regulator [Geosporobacter ferrireducens]AOT69657.1 hypothetical protein Gferi_08740 [Geosporobacter ferrireducens]MTI54638.1 MurR/RpiR family transcriptional regulator [Geosporobacter ferrireducens]